MTPEQREALVERMLEAYLRSPAEGPQDAMRAALSIAEEEIERGLIEEMRNPDDAMMTAGVEATCRVWSRQGVRDCWQAMLRAFHSSRGE